MKKKILALLLILALALPFSAEALASDVDIDIEVIGQIGIVRRGALTARWFGVDLFSPSAEEVNEALAEQHTAAREFTMQGLFEAEQIHQGAELTEQIRLAAEDALLFAAPVSFGGLGAVEAESGTSIYLLVIFLVACAICGFLLAKAMIKRREGGS